MKDISVKFSGATFMEAIKKASEVLKISHIEDLNIISAQKKKKFWFFGEESCTIEILKRGIEPAGPQPQKVEVQVERFLSELLRLSSLDLEVKTFCSGKRINLSFRGKDRDFLEKDPSLGISLCFIAEKALNKTLKLGRDQWRVSTDVRFRNRTFSHPREGDVS